MSRKGVVIGRKKDISPEGIITPFQKAFCAFPKKAEYMHVLKRFLIKYFQ